MGYISRKSRDRNRRVGLAFGVAMLVLLGMLISPGDASDCNAAIFKFPISTSRAIERNVLTAKLTVSGIGRLPITIDTGS